jgi:hypothetical protein
MSALVETGSGRPAPPAAGFDLTGDAREDDGDAVRGVEDGGSSAAIGRSSGGGGGSGGGVAKRGRGAAAGGAGGKAAPPLSEGDTDEAEPELDAADVLGDLDFGGNGNRDGDGGVEGLPAAKRAQMEAAMNALSLAGAPGVKVGWAEAVPRGAAAGPTPTVHDSWKHAVADGVTIVGLEYSTAHSDVAAARRAHAAGRGAPAPDGARYHLSLVLNAVEDVVYEVELRAPRGEWARMWAAVGATLTDNVFLNWTDDSPHRFS